MKRGCLLLILLLCLLTKVDASHYLGSSITAQNTGITNQVKVRVTEIQACSSMASWLTIYIVDSSSGTFFNWTDTVFIVRSEPISLATCSPGFASNCQSIFDIQNGVYEAIIQLPWASTKWYFEYETCCWSAASTLNLAFSNPAECSYAKLNNVAYPTDRLPEFISAPEYYFCLANPMHYFESAMDPDGDSLVYSFDSIYYFTGANTPHIQPYSSSQFFSSSTPIQINSTSGEITGFPNQLGGYALNVRVTEYRNGIDIGHIMRPQIISVINGIFQPLNIEGKFTSISITTISKMRVSEGSMVY